MSNLPPRTFKSSQQRLLTVQENSSRRLTKSTKSADARTRLQRPRRLDSSIFMQKRRLWLQRSLLRISMPRQPPKATNMRWKQASNLKTKNELILRHALQKRRQIVEIYRVLSDKKTKIKVKKFVLFRSKS